MTKKAGSYIGELSSGYESDTVVQYDPAKEEAQIGKEFEEKVETEKNWKNDKREKNGLGMLSFKEAASKLRKIARTLATIDMDMKESVPNQDVNRIVSNIKTIGDSLGNVVKADIQHPIEGRDESSIEESNSQLGDEEWIDIGPGMFDDKRDEVGKPA